MKRERIRDCRSNEQGSFRSCRRCTDSRYLEVRLIPFGGSFERECVESGIVRCTYVNSVAIRGLPVYYADDALLGTGDISTGMCVNPPSRIVLRMMDHARFLCDSRVVFGGCMHKAWSELEVRVILSGALAWEHDHENSEKLQRTERRQGLKCSRGNDRGLRAGVNTNCSLTTSSYSIHFSF